MEAMWNLKHRPSIFHFSRYESRAFYSFWLLLHRCCSTRQMCQIGSEIPVLSVPCSFLSGMTPRNSKLPPRKVSKSCKFINVMTDYYHSQQPSATRQDKTKFWLRLWLVSKRPRQVNISGYKTTWFLKSFSQESYSRYFLLSSDFIKDWVMRQSRHLNSWLTWKHIVRRRRQTKHGKILSSCHLAMCYVIASHTLKALVPW